MIAILQFKYYKLQQKKKKKTLYANRYIYTLLYTNMK